MTNEEFEAVTIGRMIATRYEWERRCKGCKHLGDTTWYFSDKSGKGHRCEHPNRQDGFSDPRPYGCGGHYYEQK